MGPRFARGQADTAQDSHDLLAAAGDRSQRDRPPAFVGREIVVRDPGSGRPLIRRPMNAEPPREAMELIGVVGEQMRPLEPAPRPDRIIDVDGHAPPAVGAPLRGLDWNLHSHRRRRNQCRSCAAPRNLCRPSPLPMCQAVDIGAGVDGPERALCPLMRTNSVPTNAFSTRSDRPTSTSGRHGVSWRCAGCGSPTMPSAFAARPGPQTGPTRPDAQPGDPQETPRRPL